MAYATVEDLEASWRDLADWERTRMERTIEDACTWLDAQIDKAGHAPADYAESLLRLITCNLVRRAVGELDPTGSDAQWQTYTDQVEQASTAAVVRGDFYLTQWERNALGVRAGRAGFSS